MAKSNIYGATFTAEDIIAAATVSLVPGQYTEIGQYTVLADELVGLGRGGYASQDQATGHLYAEFKNNANPAVAITTGKFRIMLTSSQGIPIGGRPVYLDVDMAALNTGATVPSDRFPLPFDGTLLQKDRKYKFYIYNPTSAAITLSKANSTVLMDITRMLV